MKSCCCIVNVSKGKYDFCLFSYLSNLIFINLSFENSNLLDFRKYSHIPSIDRDHLEKNSLVNAKNFWHFKLSTFRGKNATSAILAPLFVRIRGSLWNYWHPPPSPTKTKGLFINLRFSYIRVLTVEVESLVRGFQSRLEERKKRNFWEEPQRSPYTMVIVPTGR